jgi:single-stranded DNA-binding protein
VQNRFVVKGDSVEKTDQWVQIAVFEDNVNIAMNLKKGDLILVNGQLKARPWTSTKTGKSGVTTDIAASSIIPLSLSSSEEPF